jgi:hypothetical protein
MGESEVIKCKLFECCKKSNVFCYFDIGGVDKAIASKAKEKIKDFEKKDCYKDLKAKITEIDL